MSPLTLPAPSAAQIPPSHHTLPSALPQTGHCLPQLQPLPTSGIWGLWSSGQAEAGPHRPSGCQEVPKPDLGAGEFNYCLKKRSSYLKQGCFKLTLKVKVWSKPSRSSVNWWFRHSKKHYKELGPSISQGKRLRLLLHPPSFLSTPEAHINSSQLFPQSISSWLCCPSNLLEPEGQSLLVLISIRLFHPALWSALGLGLQKPRIEDCCGEEWLHFNQQLWFCLTGEREVKIF